MTSKMLQLPGDGIPQTPTRTSSLDPLDEFRPADPCGTPF